MINTVIKRLMSAWKRLSQSVWLFPVLLLIPLFLLTIFKISGSSIGIYHEYFYGSTKDSNLLVNRPLPIRSDEWMVTSQMNIAQEKVGYKKINPNIGNGQDMSLLYDVTYKDWSVIFKPHQLAFFILPLEMAFAFRWWLIVYLLIISCYFFILALMPNRRRLAALVSISVFFSPFVHWWYQYGTHAVLFYSLFAATFTIEILRSKSTRKTMAYAAGLAYCLSAFALILYPPFQLPCMYALIGFGVGYCIEFAREKSWRLTFRRLLVPLGAAVIAGLVSIAFILTRINTVHIIQQTAYPGKRIQLSGGFNLTHLMSSQNGAAFQSKHRSDNYVIPGTGLSNQSESSNFFQIVPLLALPVIFMYWLDRKKRKIDWPLLMTGLTYGMLLLWMFVPHLDFIGKITLLNTVPHQRLLVGLGLIQVLFWVLLVRNLSKRKTGFSNIQTACFGLIAFLYQVAFGFMTAKTSPIFITKPWVIALALPLTLFVILTLKRKFELAAAVLLTFSFLSVFRVNPLYRGLSVVRDTPISKSIVAQNTRQPGGWVSDIPELKDILVLNGARSLSGVYSYPQLDIWKNVDPTTSEATYNRYAHVQFNFDRDSNAANPTRLRLASADNMGVVTEPCGQFLDNNKITYILTAVPFEGVGDSCLHKLEVIAYPRINFYIYQRK